MRTGKRSLVTVIMALVVASLVIGLGNNVVAENTDEYMPDETEADDGLDGDEEIDQDEWEYSDDAGEALIPEEPDPSELAAREELLLKIRQMILYGPGDEYASEADATVGMTDEEPAEDQTAPMISPAYSTGRIHVKLKPGWCLDRQEGSTLLSDEHGETSDSESVRQLDTEFPGMIIQPLWGDAEKLERLKQRGEQKSGRTLPDLSLWYEIVPDQEATADKVIGYESEGRGCFAGFGGSEYRG